MQDCCADFPAIIPLLVDLNPIGADDSGVYARLDTAEERLVITWNQMSAFYQPNAEFTFQVSLYQDGIFEITTNGLPLPFVFDPDASPRTNPWMRGIVSGQGEPLHTNTDDLLTTAQAGRSTLLQDFYLAFRRYLHTFMLPLAIIVLGGSLLLSVAVPLMLRFSIIKPLESLTTGVRQMEAGDLTVVLPIQNEDEIGYLTGAFNAMADRLGDMVYNLEARVATRAAELSAQTEELDTTNSQLRAEIAWHKEAQAQILAQQRELATLDERARLSRELHDGLGQVLGYINVQAGAVHALLEQGQIEPALDNLGPLLRATHNAQTDLRHHLLGLRGYLYP
jgi:signal transduction histidine kinase